ncbi:hypothetical protein U9M48_001594 [Paspalum notatum var. saurae]|uniref:Uncharacterized protein n=1 Tax=Paspalum notatum var. saurae TaxID=547442 RepID=A0AAQ3PJQ0_PASNO
MATNLVQLLMHELSSPRAWFLLLLPLFVLLGRCYPFRATKAARKKQKEIDVQHPLPPSPPALPVLGHLHLVGIRSPPHVSLQSIAEKQGGDLMLLRLGSMPALVVSSPRAAEAVLRTHDHVFASRPPSVAAEVVTYGRHDIGLAPYGEYWRQAKKLVTTHLLSVRRVRSFRHARMEEVSTAVARIGEAAAAGAPVDIHELVGTFTNDLACRAVMGKSFRQSEGWNELFREVAVDASALLGGFSIEELFPFLARFGVLSKVVCAKSERVRKRWDELLDRLIDDLESKPMAAAEAASDGKKDEDDHFISTLLSVRQEYGHTRGQMKAILLDVFFGMGTAATVLDYTVIQLLQNPRVMTKLQAEVRSSMRMQGRQGEEIVGEDDLNRMPYLRAVINESLRLRPATPILTPRFSMASCVVDGHVVPAGVRVLVNLWAIGRDARSWGADADEFVPERFLDGGGAARVSYRGNDFQFLPFGAGRRQCPGINFGMAQVEVMLANLVHRFDWELPPGKEAHDIDMSEDFGLVVHRKHKLLLFPKRCV